MSDDDRPDPLDDDVIDLVLSELAEDVELSGPAELSGAAEALVDHSPLEMPAAEQLPPPGTPSTRVLGIETSCDETAAAVVVNARQVLSSVVSSQVDLHARFGGVVPEIASRAHVEALDTMIEEALSEAKIALSDVDAIAATILLQHALALNP